MAANRSEPVVAVCDAGPLIHLDELDALDLLEGFTSTLVPDAVWREVDQHRPQALHKPGMTLQRKPPTEVRVPLLASLVSALGLDQGEQQALQTTLECVNPVIFLTDDLAARTAAGALNLKTHGTVGLIIRGIRLGKRTHDQVLEFSKRSRLIRPCTFDQAC